MPTTLKATSRAATPDMASLPAPALKSTSDLSSDEFVSVPNVPIFAEHETMDPDGRKLSFGPTELQAIVDRCNRRIAETGDYAAICVGHTPTPDMRAQGAAMPELIGYAGPFRLGRMNLPDGKIRYVILADFAIFKTDFATFKRHPRRSPELWIEDRYEDMFLDPIALLGAEPPRLDMGLVYSRLTHASGRQMLRYSAVAPSAMNTFVPALAGGDPKRHAAENEQGESDMGSAQEVAAIVLDAIQELPAWKWMESRMAEENTAGEGGAAMATGGEATDTGADPALTAEAPATPATMGDPAAASGAAAAATPTAAPPAATPAEPAPPVPPAATSPPLASAEATPAPAEPLAAAGGTDPIASPVEAPAAGSSPPSEGDESPPAESSESSGDESASGDGDSDDDDDETKSPAERERMARYEAIDKAMDGMTPEDVAQYMSHRQKRYQAYEAPKGETVSNACVTKVNESDPGDTSKYSLDHAATVERYSRDYAKQGMPVQYAKAMAELNAKLDREHAARIDSERSQELERLAFADGYLLDVNEEMARCRYGKMSDAEFKNYVVNIRRRYQRMPTGVVLPPGLVEQAETADRQAFSEQNRARYAKEAADICIRSQARGKRLDYETVLDDVAAGRAGKYALNGHASTAAAK